MSIALSDAEAAIRRAWQPENTHLPEWTSLELGVSSLVQKTAVEYATRIIEKQWNERDDELAFYGFRGNALSDAALKSFPHRELRIATPLREGWQLVGHCDAMHVAEDGGVCCIEHKSHASPTPHKVDMAFRQGAAYLGLMHAVAILRGGNELVGRRETVPHGMIGQLSLELKPHDVVFPVAAWSRDETSQPFVWQPHFRPTGVLVAIAPYNPPAVIKQFPLDSDALASIRDFVLAKANAVLDSVLVGNLDAAQKWDDDHPTEFLVPFADIGDGVPELDDIGRQMAEQLRILTPQGVDQDLLDEAEAEVKRLKKLADLAMAKHSQKSGVWGGVKLSRVEVKGREVPAKQAGWQDGYSYVRSSLVVEPRKTEADA